MIPCYPGLLQNHGKALDHFLVLHHDLEHLSRIKPGTERSCISTKQMGETTPMRSSVEVAISMQSPKKADTMGIANPVPDEPNLLFFYISLLYLQN